MKFENVSLLLDSIGSNLQSHGMTVERNGKIQQMQSGVVRVNCMDCLDRTNVVQSACGQWALEQQLAAEGISLDFAASPATRWFNSLWADNGDAISKQYSSTSALKGDYTRTRKRDYRGALNDIGLTLSRYYNNIVNDYFSQTVIDFLLGNVTDRVFEEFEASMMTADPVMSMPRMRQNAIDTSARIVIADSSEEMRNGWTLLSPHDSNSIKSFPFEEVVLLLTDQALYAVRFDWNMEKVRSFERVALTSLVSVTRGTYITSTLAASQMDEACNVGFLVRYQPGTKDIERVNTRSLSTAAPRRSSHPRAAPSDDATNDDCDLEGPLRSSAVKVLAFKAAPVRSAVADEASGAASSSLSETDLVAAICDEIGRASGRAEQLVMVDDIISLANAKRSTGLLEQWGHSLKKLVWA